MSNEVDELFSDPSAGVKPRVGIVFVLVVAGLAISLFGFPCSAVPGGIVVLLGWFFAEREYARLQSGFFASDLRPTIVTTRSVAIIGVVAVSLVFVAQLLLTWAGAYEVWWPRLVVFLGRVLWGGPPEG